MMGCARTKWARVEGGYLNYNNIDLKTAIQYCC
jgi:hypothetical protein